MTPPTGRHPSAGWGPRGGSSLRQRWMDSSLRWNDENRSSSPSSVRRIRGEVGSDRLLPLVAVGEQFGLVVEQFFPGFGGEFEVWPLDDRIDRTGLLAQPAID